jgi:hypothetical protein
MLAALAWIISVGISFKNIEQSFQAKKTPWAGKKTNPPAIPTVISQMKPTVILLADRPLF